MSLLENPLLLLNSGLVIAGVLAIFKWIRQVTLDLEGLKRDFENHAENNKKDHRELQRRLSVIEERLFRRGGPRVTLTKED